MARLAPAQTTSEDPFEGTSYRLVRSLARGGMGQVYLVEHRRLGRQFVAKLLHDELASNAQLVDRFRIEAQSLGRLRHPNIVSIFDFEATRGKRPFMVTEYLQGRTIAQELASGTVFTVREAIRYARETLAALAAAHELGIVHRDIKPQNLMLSELLDGSKHIKVLDFGLARVIPGVSPRAPQPLNVPTDTGLIFGTPHYLSPEAARGQHVDHRADIYGVGLLLYTMLARRGPFDDVDGAVEAMVAPVVIEPSPPSRHARIPIPEELDTLVLRALHKDVSLRIQNAGEFDKLLADFEASLLQPGGLPGNKRPSSEELPLEHSRDRGANSVVTTQDASVEVPESRSRSGRRFLVLLSVTIIAAIATLFAGRLLFGTAGAP